MNIPLEEQVAKVAKDIKDLHYVDDVASVLLLKDETAYEFDSEINCKVRFYFKSEKAIEYLARLLGELRFDKEEILSQYKKGINYKELKINNKELDKIECGLNIIKNFIYYRSIDDMSGHFQASLNPSKPFDEDYEDFEGGSKLDSFPLLEYFEQIQKDIIKGEITYIK